MIDAYDHVPLSERIEAAQTLLQLHATLTELTK